MADKDAHDRVDGLFLFDALDDVLVAQLELERVAGAGDAVVLDRDGLEERGQAVELRRVLCVACGDGEGVGEGCCGGPEGEVLEGGVAFKDLRCVCVCVLLLECYSLS